VRIMSCNPLERKDPDLPPTFSGYPIDDTTGWEEFRAEYDRTHRELWSGFNDWMREQGAPALPDLEFIHESDQLNLSVFPGAADYLRARPLGAAWHRLESSVRETEEPWSVPERLRDGDGSLIYLSLGSLGSADVELMRRLVDVLSRTRHRYIVSKGPRADEFGLADNMWGEARVPQTSIIPEVDVVITHGGNNTVTEALRFGRPTVVLPVFWDQYDNAQRLHETGFGIRLDTYAHAPEELTGAIERLLADAPLHERLNALSSRLAAAPGTVKAADLIERATRDHQ
jgi:UDP:flavonoid glycosyltransferase YjiC (YdhE family)